MALGPCMPSPHLRKGSGKQNQRATPAGKSASDPSRGWMLQVLRPIARGIVQSFGDLSEVVIHDFSDPEHSIVWLEGNVTHRQIGGSVSEIGLAAIQGGDSQEDLIGYLKNNRDGRVLRSSTVMLRDASGHVFGCFCINVDLTDIIGLQRVLARLSPGNKGTVSPVQFTNEIDEVLKRIISEALKEHPKPPAAMTRRERLDFLASLDRRGAFHIQRGVPSIAQLLKVSRTTIYTYLEEIRSRGRRAP
jgi:predicted transcriptional regulator YheO